MFDSKDLFTVLTQENEINDKLEKIKKILDEGIDPNQPVTKEYKLGWGDIGGNSHLVYPLHQAREPEVVQLLLQYYANPNIPGFAKPGEHEYFYPCGRTEYEEADSLWDNLTPLEGACKDHNDNYRKALAIASFSPCTLQTKTIEKAIRILLGEGCKKQDLTEIIYRNSNRYGTIESLDIFKLLIFKLDQKTLFSLADKSETMAVLEMMPKRQALFESCKKISLEINNLALVWIVLKKGLQQPKSDIFKLSSDILFTILLHTVGSFTWMDDKSLAFISEHSTPEDKMKIRAFQITYTLLAESDAFYSPHQFLKETALSPVRMIRKIQNKIDQEPGTCMTEEAWKLARLHCKNISESNDTYIKQIVKWSSQREITSRMAFFPSWKQSCENSTRNRIIKRIEELTSKEYPENSTLYCTPEPS